MTSDAEGTAMESWVDVDRIWAYINPIGGLERIQAAQTEERITHQVTIRWRSDVSPRMRFLYNEMAGGITRIFLIQSILDPDEARRQLDCLCLEFITSEVGTT